MQNLTIPIRPSLKILNKYDSVEFDVSQYDSVNTSIQRLQTKLKGVRFTMKKMKKDDDTEIVKVTRTH